MTYEIRINKEWMIVSYEVFRSWDGERRKNGLAFLGPVYYPFSNQVSKERGNSHSCQ